jgi:hypothetical protein
MPTTKKIKFTKSPTGLFRLAYFPGDVVEMNTNQADVIIEAGYAEEYNPVIHQESGLPVDIPARDKLLAAGVNSLDELRQYDDLTDINGIGKKSAEAIIAYLKK